MYVPLAKKRRNLFANFYQIIIILEVGIQSAVTLFCLLFQVKLCISQWYRKYTDYIYLFNSRNIYRNCFKLVQTNSAAELYIG